MLYPPRVCFLGGSQSFCQIPRLGNLLWALELLQQCKNFFGIIVFQFVSHLAGSFIVDLMVTSFKRIYATCCASQDCCCQSLCPRSSPLLTHASAGDLQTLKGSYDSVSCGSHCSFPSVLVHTRFCLCPPSISGGYEV